VGSTTARPMAEPARVAPSIQRVADIPVRSEQSPHPAAPSHAVRTRLCRSA
jgi:hypothetical protein